MVIISVDVNLLQTKCGTSAMQDDLLALNRESKQALTYSEYTDKIIGINEFSISKRYTITAYCKIKLEIIDEDLSLILKGLSGKTK